MQRKVHLVLFLELDPDAETEYTEREFTREAEARAADIRDKVKVALKDTYFGDIKVFDVKIR